MPVGAYESASALAKDLTGGQKFMKIVILVLNVIYLIFGIVLCALGGAAFSGYAASIAGSTLPTGLIVIGVFLIFTAIVGGFSAHYEFRLGLSFYFVAMLVWTIILFAIGIAVLAVKSNLQTYLAKGWALADPGTQETIQSAFACCGRYSQVADSYSYGETGWNSNTDPLILFINPNSPQAITAARPFATFPPLTYISGGNQINLNGCPGPFDGTYLDGSKPPAATPPLCSTTAANSAAQPARGNCTSLAQGCVPALNTSLQSNWQAAGGAGIAFAVIMAIGLAFTVLLIRGIGTKTENAAIERNRLKTQRDIEERRKRGKGGLKIPQNVL